MTLCMAAICWDEEADMYKIAFSADRYAEVPWAGGNVALKLIRISDNWRALIAGETSKAHDLVSTCRLMLNNADNFITSTNVLDMFNEASSRHKEKLCRRFIRQQLGIDFDRFLTRGEAELPADVRARVFHEMAQLEYGCELLFIGFTSDFYTDEPEYEPQIIEIDRYGEVFLHKNFAAVGTGSVIAKSILYLRDQASYQSIENTLYGLYEAARLAAETAPGVGEIDEFIVWNPPSGGDEGEALIVTEKGLKVLEMVFKKVGIKRMPDEVTGLDEECFQNLSLLGQQADATQSAESETEAQPLESEKSEGQQ